MVADILAVINGERRPGIAFWLVYILLMGGVLLVLLFQRSYDDPYITYRYARNISSGIGFVYNPGERVLSTTTPLLTVLLAAFAPVFPEIPGLANFISILCMLAGGWLFWQLGQAWHSPLAGWAGLLLYPTSILLAITTGSETPMYLALVLGAFAAYARQRYLLTGLLAALAALARPDGVLVALVLVVDFLIRRQSPIPWKATFIYSGILLVWLVPAWIYFGSPIPATLAAKQAQASMAISQDFLQGFTGLVKSFGTVWHYWLQAVLGLIGGAWLLGKGSGWKLLLAWSVLYFTAYSLLDVSRYYWYYTPLAPGFLALAGLGLHALSQTARRFGALRTALVLLLLVMGMAVAQINDLVGLSDRPDARMQIYQDVGRWLEQSTAVTDRVGVLEVGVIGYYAQRQMVDFAGLLYPDIASQLVGATDYETAARYVIEHYQPEILVLNAGIFPGLESELNKGQCAIIKEFPGESYRFAGSIKVYSCSE